MVETDRLLGAFGKRPGATTPEPGCLTQANPCPHTTPAPKGVPIHQTRPSSRAIPGGRDRSTSATNTANSPARGSFGAPRAASRCSPVKPSTRPTATGATASARSSRPSRFFLLPADRRQRRRSGLNYTARLLTNTRAGRSRTVPPASEHFFPPEFVSGRDISRPDSGRKSPLSV